VREGRVAFCHSIICWIFRCPVGGSPRYWYRRTSYILLKQSKKKKKRGIMDFFLIEKSFQGFLILKPRLALVNLVVFCTLAYSELQSSLNKKTREMEKIAGRIFWEMEFVYSTTHVILEWNNIYFKLKWFFCFCFFNSFCLCNPRVFQNRGARYAIHLNRS